MPINFNSLGDRQPRELPPAGKYIATIEKAEHKLSKAGKDMLSVTFDLKTLDGKKVPGKLFDFIMDGEHNLVQYKLKRFIIACGLLEAIQEYGEFELKDLGKLVVGKTIVVDTVIEKNEQYGDKLKVDTVKDRVFYELGDPEINVPYVGEINANDSADLGHPIDNGNEVF